jgi:hypothetical protein
MTFIAVDEPLGAGERRLTESYEERRGTSSASTRAGAGGFNIAVANIARNTVSLLTSGVLINGVRTSGSDSSVQSLLGERAWQLGTTALDRTNGVAVDSSGNAFIAGITNGSFADAAQAGFGDLFLARFDSLTNLHN